MFGPTREEVTLGWRKLCNEEFHNMYYPPDIISIKTKLKWVSHIVCRGEMRNVNLNGRHHLKELGMDGRITCKLNFNGLGCGLYSSSSG
jgi:hypothetical protein